MATRLKDLITPFDPGRIAHSSYELRMGDEAFVTHPEKRPETRLNLRVDDKVTIPPGQFAHLLTAERVAVPAHALGFISVKFGLKRRGLINVSGFHVDPGFDGKLVFSVYNAGPESIVISRGQPTFLLWYCNLEGTTQHTYGSEHHLGSRHGLEHIRDDDVMALQGDVYSPQALAARIRELESQVAGLKTFRKTILGGVVTPLFVLLIATVVINNWPTIVEWLAKLWPF